MIHVAVVYHSAFGHTRAVAEAIADGVASVPDVSAVLLSVDDIPAPSASAIGDGAVDPWTSLDAADAIIMGCPTYMGSVSAAFKMFMERSSGRWGAQAWRDKLAAGFTNGGGLSGDKLNALVDLMIFAGQHSMIWVSQGVDSDKNGINRMGSYSGYMAQSDNGPADLSPPPEDRQTARLFGERVARATARWAGA